MIKKLLPFIMQLFIQRILGLIAFLLAAVRFPTCAAGSILPSILDFP